MKPEISLPAYEAIHCSVPEGMLAPEHFCNFTSYSARWCNSLPALFSLASCREALWGASYVTFIANAETALKSHQCWVLA